MNITFRLIIEAIIAILLCGSLFAIIYAARRAAAKPLPDTEGAELFTVIAASGRAEGLEQTVQGLLWLGESGELKSRVVIADCGLEKQTRLLAEICARDSADVTLCTPVDLPLVLEENGWTVNT